MFECEYLNSNFNFAAFELKQNFYKVLRIVMLSHFINSNCKLENMLQKAWRQSIQLEREHKCLFPLRKISKKSTSSKLWLLIHKLIKSAY